MYPGPIVCVTSKGWDKLRSPPTMTLLYSLACRRTLVKASFLRFGFADRFWPLECLLCPDTMCTLKRCKTSLVVREGPTQQCSVKCCD